VVGLPILLPFLLFCSKSFAYDGRLLTARAYMMHRLILHQSFRRHVEHFFPFCPHSSPPQILYGGEAETTGVHKESKWCREFENDVATADPSWRLSGRCSLHMQ